MAVQYVGGTTAPIAGFTSGTVSVSLTSLTGGIGTQPAEGDIIIVGYTVATSGPVATLIIQDADETNYSLIGSELFSDDVRDTTLRVAYKFAGSAPDTSVEVGPTGNVGYVGTVAVMVWRGVDPDTVLDVATVTQSQSNPSSSWANPPAIAPASDGATVIAIGGGAGPPSTAVYTSSDLSNFLAETANAARASMIGMGSIAWVSGDGTINPAQFGGTATDTSSSWAALTLALRPLDNTRSATASITEGGDTAGATGELDIAAAAAVAESGDTLAGAGALPITGSADIAEAGDSLSSTGLFTVPAVIPCGRTIRAKPSRLQGRTITAR